MSMRIYAAEGYPNVYIIGDTALAREAETGAPVPPTAQAALQQADVAAAHLLHTIKGVPQRVTPYAGPKPRGSRLRRTSHGPRTMGANARLGMDVEAAQGRERSPLPHEGQSGGRMVG